MALNIEITFRLIDGRYVFASEDKKILIAHPNRGEAAAFFFFARFGTHG